jgi:hypothetical protein
MSIKIELTDEQKAQMWDYLARCVNEVESHLRVDDVVGANDLMDAIEREAGTGVHEIVLNVVANLRGQSDWRTFVPREP